jgi:lipoate-protein ligase A
VDALFDVEQFRALPDRYAVARRVDRVTVVLGSTQTAEILNAEALAASGAAVVRRRGGGGAVLLRPGDHLWVDVWIPRDDPLWESDVAAGALWAGGWWRRALSERGADPGVVHHGRAEPGPHGALVCFSGRGPGELFLGGRKVMGISQWRSREGSLFHTCAYTHWDPRPLVELLDLDPLTCDTLLEDLARSAIGVDDLDLGRWPISALEESLLSSLPTWKEDRPGRPL